MLEEEKESVGCVRAISLATLRLWQHDHRDDEEEEQENAVEYGRTIDRVATPTYDQFFRFMQRNQPVLVTGLLDQWGSTQQWVHSDGSIDWRALLSRYSDLEAPVHRLDRDGECCVQTMTFGEFTAASFGISLDGSSSGGCESTAQASLYLKDWHLARLRPEPPFYRLPLICSDDWLNCPARRGGCLDDCLSEFFVDDYRFVYIGKRGTQTRLHADVFRSYSWSANVVGRKRWTLFHPSQTHLLKDDSGQMIEDLNQVDRSRCPGLQHTTPLVVEQLAGEMLFVPSGWYHQVENLEDTISINHNWFNACCIDRVFEFLMAEQQAVIAELSAFGVRESCATQIEWLQQCEVVMRANTGITLQMLWCLTHRVLACELEHCRSLLDSSPILLEELPHELYHSVYQLTTLRSALGKVAAQCCNEASFGSFIRIDAADEARIAEAERLLALLPRIDLQTT